MRDYKSVPLTKDDDGLPGANRQMRLPEVIKELFVFRTTLFTYAGSGYNSFFGIVSDTPFSSISFTAAGDGDRWRLDNVSIGRQGSRATR